MALSNAYYESLKTQLEALALAKKNAIDLQMQQYSTATFDDTGKLTGYGEKGLGSRDVSQLEGERRLGGVAEGAGMLRSGQYARDLATSQAIYRADILGKRGQAAGEKQAIEYDLASELAKAQASYGTGVGGGTGGGTGSGGGAGGGGGTSDNQEDQQGTAITPPPVYTPPAAPTPQRTPAGVTSPLPSGFKPKKPEAYVPPKKKPAAPAKPVVPAKPTPPARGGSTRLR